MTEHRTLAGGHVWSAPREVNRDVLEDLVQALEPQTLYVGMVRTDRTGQWWRMDAPGYWSMVGDVREVG